MQRMASVLQQVSMGSRSTRWSLYAGFYMYACGTMIAFVLSDILLLLTEIIGLDPAYSLFLLAGPAFVVGGVAWWALIERHQSYTYLRGGVFGSLSALVTGLLWTLQFVSVWGLKMLTADTVPLVVGVVLGVVTVGGILTGLPFMFARRRSTARPPRETEHAP